MHPCDNAETLLRMLSAPRRNHYFYGKRMDVQHFQMEQDYGKLKQWLLNRLTLGKGVLCGLDVQAEDGKLCVEPGVAIDGLGREIIVPIRTCIDPLAQEEGCCASAAPPPASEHERPHEPPREPYYREAEGADEAIERAAPPEHSGIITLWACYRECKTDYQPVLVSDCETREHCAAGTIVESFYLKVTEGHPPPLVDPTWCAKLWGKHEAAHQPAEPDEDAHDHGREAPTRSEEPPGLTGHETAPATLMAATPRMEDVRRYLLCQLLQPPCTNDEDPCVPLAVALLRDGQIRFLDTCVVRPRVYSNAVLLDLILCLADKIEECCGDGGGEEPPPPPPEADLLRIKSVEFLEEQGQPVAAVTHPNEITEVSIGRRPRSILVRFTRAIDQNTPSTHAMGEPDYKRHNVQVLPERDVLNGIEFVPGTLALGPDWLRFDLYPEGPYVRRSRNGAWGWQKGLYRLRVCGDADATAGRKPIKDDRGWELDGEAIVPSGSAISGDGTKGGDFSLLFNVG